jgi:hypothetical protein
MDVFDSYGGIGLLHYECNRQQLGGAGGCSGSGARGAAGDAVKGVLAPAAELAAVGPRTYCFHIMRYLALGLQKLGLNHTDAHLGNH